MPIDHSGVTVPTLDELTAGHIEPAMAAFDRTGIKGERSAMPEIRLGEPG